MSDNSNSSDSECESSRQVKKIKMSNPKEKKFNVKWLEDPGFKRWLKAVPNNNKKCVCKVCNTEILCGKSELTKHAVGKKHLRNMAAVNSSSSIRSFITPTSTTIKHQNAVKSAEIRLSIFFAEHNVGTHIIDHLTPLLKDIFPDSKVCQDIQLGRTKCTEMIKNVVGKYETNLLVKDLRDTSFSVLVDETTDISSKKSMCVLVRYVKQSKVVTQLLELVQLNAADCSAVELFNYFKNCFTKYEIPITNIVGVASDGANVMVGKNNSFFSHLKTEVPDVILMRCICHSAALVASAGCAELPSSVENLIRSISTYISGSAKRCAILQEIQEFMQLESTKILSLSTTRWLSRHACIVRILDNWEAIKHFFTLAVFEDKLKSAEDILSEMQDMRSKAYLLFLKYALNFLNSFNALFQARIVLIHKLFDSSEKLFKQICSNFLKPEVYAANSNLSQINVKHPNNFQELENINLGIECEEFIHNMPQTEKNDILKMCLQFYITVAAQIQSRLPLNNNFFRNLQFLDPNVAFNFNNRTKFNIDIKEVAKMYPNHIDLTALSLEWQNLPNTFNDFEISDLKNMPMEEMWLKITDCKNFNEEYLFPTLKEIIKIVLSLPHSNAEAERIFSCVTDIKSKKRNLIGDDNLNAMCVLRSSLQNNNINCTKYAVNDEHLKLHNYKMYDFKN